MTQQQDLEGRIAVVTGASAGIGEACAHELASRGARVVINARRAEKLSHLHERLGGDAHARVVAGDASEQATVDACLDAARDAFGGEADLVIVNAGRGLSGSVLTSDEAQWEQMTRINLLGAGRLMRTAGRRMLADAEADAGGGGSLSRARDIVVLGSTVGRHISPFSSMYGSTKFAVNSLAEAMRREVAGRGVRVTLVEPGIVLSEFQAGAGYDDQWRQDVTERFGPLLTPADVAETIGWVCSRPARVHVNDLVIRPTRQEYP